MKVLKFPSLT